MEKSVESCPWLHGRVYVGAALFLAAAAGLFAYGRWLVRQRGNLDGHGLSSLAFAIGLAALITAAVFARHEFRFRQAMKQPLLRYEASWAEHEKATKHTIAAMQQAHRVTRLTVAMLCGLLALISLLLRQGIMAIIALAIAAVMAVVSSGITRWRAHRLRRGSRVMMLAKNGAYAAGQFHGWGTFHAKLIQLTWHEPGSEAQSGLVVGRYRVLAAYRSHEEPFALAVPPQQRNKARQAVQEIVRLHGVSEAKDEA